MKYSTLVLSALVAIVGVPAWAQTGTYLSLSQGSATTGNGPAAGVITVTPRLGAGTGNTGLNPALGVGNPLTGMAYYFGNLSMNSGPTNNAFYTLAAGTFPTVAPTAFVGYNMIVSNLTENETFPDANASLSTLAGAGGSYSALTFVEPALFARAQTFFTIHHNLNGIDYLAQIVPGSATSVADVRQMSVPNGGAGYFALAFARTAAGATPSTTYGANSAFYLRTAGGHTLFGEVIPAAGATSTIPEIDLDTATGSFGASGFSHLAWIDSQTGATAAGGAFQPNQFYYLREDTATGNTILGQLDSVIGPGHRTISDIANLGGHFTTLVYAFDATGFGAAWGTNQMYATGTQRAASAQSVSFAAIPDHNVGDVFFVTPTASSGLELTVTVESGSNSAVVDTVGFGQAGRTFRVTTTGPGIVRLRAKQTKTNATAFDTNWLDQSFNVVGSPVITTPLAATGTAGTPFAFSGIPTNGTPTSFAITSGSLPSPLVFNTTTGAITGTPSAASTSSVTVTATNATGTSVPATLTITIAPLPAVAPIITNNPLTTAGTVGTPFSFQVTATGTATITYGATGLPPGLSIASGTGLITGSPTTNGTSIVLLTVDNGVAPQGTATLTIAVSTLGVAPIITSPTTAAATVGVTFSYAITATSSPTSFTATGLPAGLTLNTTSGVITGVPTTAGTKVVTLTATNASAPGTPISATLTIVVAPVGVAPIITSPTTAPGTVGKPFVTYIIVATGLPTSFTATGLPTGLTLSSTTGAINGTPTTAGTYVVALKAINTTGTGTATLTIIVAPAAVAPIITSATTAPGTVGSPFITYIIAATGLPTSFTATGLPNGLTLSVLTGAINGTPTTAGTSIVGLTATNTTGTGTATLTITVAPAAVAPIITSPRSAAGTSGTPFVTYLIGATGVPTSYTATGLPPGLTLDPLTGAINGTPTTAGTYVVTLTATNTAGTSTVSLTMVIDPVASSRIVNFSARALSGPGDQTLIMGFVVAGNGKNLLVRGIGPSLAAYGIANPLADPMLTLYGAAGAIATNDDWQLSSTGQANGSVIAAVAAQVGAFALPNGSKDSALLATFNNGAHTTSMVRPNSTTGIALTEIYDVDTVLGSRLINVSARMNVGVGENALFAGFVIAGNIPKTVLIRGVGPALTAYAVTGVLTDPQIAVYSGSTQIATNDNWETGTSTAAQMSAASAQVGAFALPPGSRDAALVITLPPGAYTVQVTGVGNATGVALVEIYDTQSL